METPANGEKSLSSKLIAAPFTVLELLVIYPMNTNNKLIYRFFLSTAFKVPDTGTPGGRDLFSDVIEAGEFVGENLTYSIPVQKKITEEDMFLQMYSRNDNGYPLISSALAVVAIE